MERISLRALCSVLLLCGTVAVGQGITTMSTQQAPPLLVQSFTPQQGQ